MKPRISMITLGVSDLAKSAEFYEAGLGFPKMESPPEVAFFTLNGTWLGLYSREALAADATVSAGGSGFGGFTLSHNVASEHEVEQVIEQAVFPKTIKEWVKEQDGDETALCPACGVDSVIGHWSTGFL